MTHSMLRPISQRRKVACSTGATLAAFAALGWWLPAARLPHATLLTQLLSGLGLLLPVALTLLALPTRSTGTAGGGRAS